MIHENIELTGSFNVNGTLVIPTHAATSSALSATGSIYNDSTENVVKLYTGTEWIVVGDQTTPPPSTIEYLLVAGGAGSNGGGGGAGGLLSSSLNSVVSGSSFTITVGAGGANSGGNGDDTQVEEASITTIIAVGGGYGANYNGDAGGNGGSGGGGSYGYSGQKSAGSGTVGQGNDGGTATTSAGGGAGGGGAGEPGANQSTRKGGDGLQSNITGTPTYYAGGGGGGKTTSSGGLGGGGAGSLNTATAGSPNTGGGGGGSWNTGGATGGSGVAIFAYDSGSFNCAGGIVGDAGNGRKYNQFNSSGTFKVASTTDFSIVDNSNLVMHVDAGNFASRGTSTTAYDLSTYSNNLNISGQSGGTLTNNPWWNGNGSSGLADFERNGGSTASNVAHTGYGSMTGASNNAWTIEFWIKSTATSGNATIGKTIIGTNSSGIWASISIKSNKLAYVHHDGSWSTKSSTSSINDGNWHHCVLANYSNETMDIYVDSTREQTGVVSGLDSGRYMKMDSIARGYNGENTAMDLGQLRVYDITLTPAQVLQNYNATKTNFI